MTGPRRHPAGTVPLPPGAGREHRDVHPPLDARAPRVLSDIDAADRARAGERCRAGGATERDALEECVFDVALTGDVSFIESARSLQTRPALRPDGEGPPAVPTEWTSDSGPMQFERAGGRMPGAFEDGQSRISGTARGSAGRHLAPDAYRTPVRQERTGTRHRGRLRFTFVTDDRFERLELLRRRVGSEPEGRAGRPGLNASARRLRYRGQ